MPVGLTRMRFRRLRRAGGRRLARTVDAWVGSNATFSCKQKSVLNPSIQDAWQPSPRTAKTLLDSTWQQKSCKSHIRNFHRLRRNSKTLPEVIAESSFLRGLHLCLPGAETSRLANHGGWRFMLHWSRGNRSGLVPYLPFWHHGRVAQLAEQLTLNQ